MKRILPLLAALAALAFQSPAAVPPVEKLLPDDTLVLLSIPDFAKVREIYSNSPQGQLWRDPSLKAFKEKFLDKLKETWIAPLERELGVQLADYSSLPQGQLTLALTQNGWDGKDLKEAEPGLLLLMDTKDKSGQLKTNLADLKKKWLDAGKKARIEKIRDAEFSIITLSSNDVPKSLKKAATDSQPADATEAAENPEAKKAGDKKEIYIGQADSLLVVGNSAKAIEKVLARMSGADIKTVSDVPAYQADQAALFRDANLFAWVNAKVFVDMLCRLGENSGAGDSNPMGVKPEKVVAALGLTGLKTVALSYRYSEEGAQGTLFLGVPEVDRTGLFRILAGEGKDCSPPSFVPADAVKFQRWRIDGQKAWAAIQKIVSDINPQWINLLNYSLTTAESLAKEKNPDFDIKKNLFGNLGDDLIIYSKLPKGDHLADLNSGPSLTLIGSPNGEQLVAALRSLLLLMGQPAGTPTEREFLGRKIYTMPATGLGSRGGGATPRNLNYAFGGGYLAIAGDSAILEEYLRSSQSKGKSLRDAPGLNEAMQKVAGRGTSFFNYSNDSETMRVTLAALKGDFDSALSDGSLGPVMGALGLGPDFKAKEWFDVSLLPSYDKIAKYFSFSVFAETATADGLAFKGFTPTPAGLKQGTGQ
jgi:hypothetical protein